MLSIPRIRECIAPICKKYPIRKAYLFGSYARGNATEKSDVDLRIEGDIKSFLCLAASIQSSLMHWEQNSIC